MSDIGKLDALGERIDELEAEVERKDERIEGLEQTLLEYKHFAGSEFADVRSRLDDIETQAQTTETTEDNPTTTQPAETPLERICTLPEHVADRELTTNQERARFIACAVRDYAEKGLLGSCLTVERSRRSSRRRRNEAAHANCRPRHGFPREIEEGRGRPDQAAWQEAHGRQRGSGRPVSRSL